MKIFCALEFVVFHVTIIFVRAILKKEYGGMTGKSFDTPLLTYIFMIFASIFNIEISCKTPLLHFIIMV